MSRNSSRLVKPKRQTLSHWLTARALCFCSTTRMVGRNRYTTIYHTRLSFATLNVPYFLDNMRSFFRSFFRWFFSFNLVNSFNLSNSFVHSLTFLLWSVTYSLVIQVIYSFALVKLRSCLILTLSN